MSYKLLEDVEKSLIVDEYYCANSVEKLFGHCENTLTYAKNGGYGFNYRYCSSCYAKWNDKKLREQSEFKKGICYITW